MFGFEYAVESDLESLCDFTDEELLDEIESRGLHLRSKSNVLDCLKDNIFHDLKEISNRKRLGFNVDNDIEQLINDVNCFEDHYG